MVGVVSVYKDFGGTDATPGTEQDFIDTMKGEWIKTSYILLNPKHEAHSKLRHMTEATQ